MSSWFIQTKADGIQGFSRFFRAKYRYFQGHMTNMEVYFNNYQLKAKNHFSRYFSEFKALKTFFFNSRLFKGFQGLCEPWSCCIF